MNEPMKFYRPYKGWIEIIPTEIGKTWIVNEPFIVFSEDGKQLTIPKDFRHDRYTFAPNLPDNIPAIAHDYAGKHRFWDDGTPITWAEWNSLLLHLMRHSWSRVTRYMAWPYYIFVSGFDWAIWNDEPLITFHFICRNPDYALENVRNLSAVRKAMEHYRRTHLKCEYCGRAKKLDVHHIVPVHLSPSQAADESNMIMLCRKPQCHLVTGHLGDFKDSNARIRQICAVLRS